MKNRPSPIQKDEIQNTLNNFTAQGKCPFSGVIKYINTVSKLSTTDRLPPIRNAIAQLISLFHKKATPSHKQISHLSSDLSNASSAKLYKHLYDVVFLQEELYPLIQALLRNTEGGLGELATDSSKLNLHDKDTRFIWGSKFISTVGRLKTAVIDEWEESKSGDNFYEQGSQYAQHHAELAYNKESSFGYHFNKGMADGLKNIRSLVDNIPELFYAKYKRFPNRIEYRSLMEENIKSVILPLSSINLDKLIRVIRPPEREKDEEENLVKYLGSIVLIDGGRAHLNYLDINTTDFFLDDEDKIGVTEPYLKKRAQMINEDVDLAEYVFHSKKYGKNYTSGGTIDTGCPALRAQTKEGISIVEQFCNDVLGLLDEIYFPYRDK